MNAVLVLLSTGIVLVIIYLLINRRYSLPCPVWLHKFVELDNPFTETNRAAFIIENLDLVPGMKVVDAGCGPGRLTIPVSKIIGPSGKVLALDIQQGMLDLVAQKSRAAGLNNIEYLNVGLGMGKLKNNEYDRALLITVLGEIRDQKAALKEIFDALKSGGVLSITELIFDPHFQRLAHVETLATQIGFIKKGFYGNRFAYNILFEKPMVKD